MAPSNETSDRFSSQNETSYRRPYISIYQSRRVWPPLRLATSPPSLTAVGSSLRRPDFVSSTVLVCVFWSLRSFIYSPSRYCARPHPLACTLPPSLPSRHATEATARADLGGGRPSARRRPHSSSSSSSTTTTPLPPRAARQRVAPPRVCPLRRQSSPRPRGQPAEAPTPRTALAAEGPPWWAWMTTGRSRQQPRWRI